MSDPKYIEEIGVAEHFELSTSVCRHNLAWPHCVYCHSIRGVSEEVRQQLDRIESLLVRIGGQLRVDPYEVIEEMANEQAEMAPAERWYFEAKGRDTPIVWLRLSDWWRRFKRKSDYAGLVWFLKRTWKNFSKKGEVKWIVGVFSRGYARLRSRFR